MVKIIKQQNISIRQACNFYNVRKTALQRWLKNSSIKKTRDKPPSKIHDDLLLKNIEQHSDDYMYKRAQCFKCRKTCINTALKRLGISQLKDIETSKGLSDKNS